MENKEKEIDLVELFKAVWAQKRKLIRWGVIGLVVGVVVALSIPREYQAVVKIAPEGKGQSGAMGSMGGLASMMGVNLPGGSAMGGITEEIYPEIVKSTPFLLEFAGIEVEHEGVKTDLYTYLTQEQRSAWWGHVFRAPMQAIGWVRSIGSDKQLTTKDTISIFRPSGTQKSFTSSLTSRIMLEPDKKSGVFTVTVRMQDALISAIVADSLVSKLQRYMTEYRTSKARNDLEINEKMFQEARQKYYAADAAYALGQDRNQNLILKSAQMQVDRLSNEKNLAFTVYQQLASQVEMSKLKLQEDTPIATIIEPASVPLQATSPNKKLIVFAFTFLGIMAAAGVVVVKQMLKYKAKL